MKGLKRLIISLILFISIIVFITSCGDSPEAAAPAAESRFTIWVPSASGSSDSGSSRGLTDLIADEGVFDTGNPSFDSGYAKAVLQCMPFFSKLEKIEGVSSSTKPEDLKGSLQYSMFGFSFVPDMTRTSINNDGIYVYCKAYEGNDSENNNPIGIIEYYYNFKKQKLTYRQYVMLTIVIDIPEYSVHNMENAVLVYCLEDVSVGADGSLAVNQLKDDGTFETKEAFTDYLWIRNTDPHMDFERRVITLRNDDGVTATFSQPWAEISYKGSSWDTVDDSDSLKTLLKSKTDVFQITEENKDTFDGYTAVAFAKLAYEKGASIAKESGWTNYDDFAAASLVKLNSADHEWLFGEAGLKEGTLETGGFWMSYFDYENALNGDKKKRAYYDSVLLHKEANDTVAYYLGSSNYERNGFSNLFGAYAGTPGNREVTEYVLTQFLPFCLKASKTDIAAMVAKIVSAEDASQHGQIPESEHVHTFSDVWKTDRDFHWHEATCSHKYEVSERALHTWETDDWITSKEPTLEDVGEAYKVCKVCGYKDVKEIPAIDNPVWAIDGANNVSPRKKLQMTGNVVIPEKVNGKTVLGIQEKAFSGCSKMTGITIPETVTYIGHEAFDGCYGLTEIVIPDSVTYIGNSAFFICSCLESVTIGKSVTSINSSAFHGCASLTSINIPDSVTSIGVKAFYNCPELKDVIIPDSVTSIGANAFSKCTSLEEITLPSSVTDIGYEAFSGCTNLKNVTISASSLSDYLKMNIDVFNTPYDLTVKVNGELLTGEVEIPSGVTSIPKMAFYNCAGITSITIPNTVTSIGAGAFWECADLKSVTIPDSVTSLGSGAFSGCTSLTDVVFSKSVTSIEDSTFSQCSNLKSITIPDSVTSIGYGAFNLCSSLTSITIPDKVTYIGATAFYSCTGLTAVNIGKSVETIGSSAFFGCSNLENVDIPNSVKTIGYGAFNGCSSLTSITIPDSVTSIEDWALSGCGFTEITLPSSITSINTGLLSGCVKLTHFTIPDSVTSIGTSAFDACYELTSIYIPVSVTEIGQGAFHDNIKLEEAYYSGTKEQWKAITTETEWWYYYCITTVHCSDGDLDPREP